MAMTLTASDPNCRFEDLFLSEAVTASIVELLEDIVFRTALEEAGLFVRSRVLLHGPPGCGKTSIANALAQKLKMKICPVSMGQVMASHLGEAERNVEGIFQFAAVNRVLILLDEFDSIGASRQDPGEAASTASNRVVNSILTSMDRMKPLGMVVACTNLYGSIDPAIIRRFDMRLEIPTVSKEGLRQIAESIFKGRHGLSVDAVLEVAATPAAVVQEAQNMLRRKVIEEEKHRRAQNLDLFQAPVEAPSEIKELRQKLAKGAKQ